jgi:putative sigma-54 modulation protein
MQVSVTFRRIDATDALRRYADAKVRRVAGKCFRRPVEAHVVLSVSKRRHGAEITLVADRVTLHSKEETGDLYSAIDLAVDKLERQAKKRKTKRRASKNAGATARRSRRVPSSGLAEDDASPPAIRSERFVTKPMSVEDAALELDGSGRSFLVFRNASDETLNVIYRRKDGNYGLIQPDAIR